MSGQGTDIESIIGYGWWDNCQKYWLLLQVLKICFFDFAFSLFCKGPCFSMKCQNQFVIYFMYELWGMQCYSWLRHYTTSWKVVGSIPDVIGFSIVGIATSYGLDDQGVGVRVPIGSRMFSSTNRPDRLWGPPNLLSNGYRCSFPGDKAAGA
jgi:hypothetical protein